MPGNKKPEIKHGKAPSNKAHMVGRVGAIRSPARYISKATTHHKPKTDATGKKIEEEEEGPEPMVSFNQLFLHADARDIILVVAGCYMALILGMGMPCFILIFGQMTNVFAQHHSLQVVLMQYEDNITETCNLGNGTKPFDEARLEPEVDIFPCLESESSTEGIYNLTQRYYVSDFNAQIRFYAIAFAALGIAVWILFYIEILCFQISSLRIVQKIRQELFGAILDKDMEWFDSRELGEVTTRLSEDVTDIQKGIGEKIGLCLQWVCTFLACFVIGLIYRWEITLVIFGFSPVAVLTAYIISKMGSRLSGRELEAYARSGAVAEEVFTCINTVIAYNGQVKEVDRYAHDLDEACHYEGEKGMISGIGLGLATSFYFAIFGVTFWYGSQLFVTESFSVGNVIIVLFAVLTAAFSLANIAPALDKISLARGAAYEVYNIMDTMPKINISVKTGLQPNKLVGKVELRNVSFSYPTRTDVKILKNFNMEVGAGQTVALVGMSGIGKTTVLNLVQRLYDVDSGEVLIDGQNIKVLNIKWLRNQIGVVHQEPFLFRASILENIMYGNPNATMQQVERATREANIDEFISSLPSGYDTIVEEHQISGGQKQRIAIARALVKDPKILLLDEPTSALDVDSENSVQDALNRASEGRTTIVVAHRVSGVSHANKICGLSDGRIVEEGTHNELIKKPKGLYKSFHTHHSHANKAIEESRTMLQPITKSGGRRRSQLSDASFNASVKKRAMKIKIGKDQKEQAPQVSFFTLMAFNDQEWYYIAGACVGSILCGISAPAFGIMFAEMAASFTYTEKTTVVIEGNFYALAIVTVGVLNSIGLLMENWLFAYSGAALTRRLRILTFEAYLRQDSTFYDNPDNSPGALCERLGVDTAIVHCATGLRLGTALQALTAISVALGLGFYFNWQLTLFILGFVPIVLAAVYIQMHIYSNRRAKVDMEEAHLIATESIENMKTVVALRIEENELKKYTDLTADSTNILKSEAHKEGVVLGFAASAVFFAYSACFAFGAYLITSGYADFRNVFKVFMAIIFSAQEVGDAISFIPDYRKALEAGSELVNIFDMVPSVDICDDKGIELQNADGTISLKNVTFSYPTRPMLAILKKVDLEIPRGKTVAIVGHSGSGKSTILKMIERFYDPVLGSLSIYGEEYQKVNVQSIRSHIGYVDQEPTFFEHSVAENISYGDNDKHHTMDEIITAAREADIHEFIQTLPKGYETFLGSKGHELSVGQKQRLAIARALIGNPKILLLDEPTAGLDEKNEEIVENSLKLIRQRRTVVLVTNKLETIEDANIIIVIDQGYIVEAGTHNQLLRQNGLYANMHRHQIPDILATESGIDYNKWF